MKILFSLLLFYIVNALDNADEVTVCGGFIEFEGDEKTVAEIKKNIDYSMIHVQYFTTDTTDMRSEESTNLAASGYYFLPIYNIESFILKITGPHNMNFEPEQYVFNVDGQKTIKDVCKNDINFKFRGFIPSGQISTFGTNDGPEGINLALYNLNGEKLQTTTTFQKGVFQFKPVNPGEYILRPQDNIDMFDPNHKELKFRISINSSNVFNRALIIKGYKVLGKVEADGEPLEGVNAYIYSYNLTLVKNYKCDSNITLDHEYKGLTPFCAFVSNKQGNFIFTNIPYGKFLIRPLYQDKYVSYELQPDHINVDIEHYDFKIEQPFVVNSFSIWGRVINSKRTGVPNVTIRIDGQGKAKTDSQGIYKLERLTKGNYDLEAQADDMFFDPLTNIKITAHLKTLPDLMVTDYKLCGFIIIDTDYYTTAKRTVVLQDASDKTTKKERRTITDTKGKYCFEVKPGKYHIFPVLTQDEKETDLHLQPESYDLEVVDRPLLDQNFYQSKVVVSGKITCIEECDKDIKIKLVSGKTDKMVIYFNTDFK
jgi:hypothetical protein